jgi:pimeloyl-ACP methyl ester carboxylesterase
MSDMASWTFDREERTAAVPLWRETLFGIDLLALHTSPTFFGCGVPRGDGSAVVVVPGFLGSDWYLLDLYYWLRRVGYRAYFSQIGRNAECLDVLMGRLLATIDTARADTGGKVHLVGHSLGGMLVRSAAWQRSEDVASVIMLGSPFRGIRSHPLVMHAATFVRTRVQGRRREEYPACFTADCHCTAVTGFHEGFPASIPQTAVYTRTDGIVDWRACVNDDPDTDVEVSSTHIGLAFNASVFRVIGSRLAAAQSSRSVSPSTS